ncbi:hypothetical protein AX16_000400 [Volvariella volvacea WC 439]|nr:hypothetical protein AX16_000400 [Volvariella volvacea WC 439]
MPTTDTMSDSVATALLGVSACATKSPSNSLEPCLANGSPKFKLGNFCIDNPQPMKVEAIGPGFSGIYRGLLISSSWKLTQQLPPSASAKESGTWIPRFTRAMLALVAPGLQTNIPVSPVMFLHTVLFLLPPHSCLQKDWSHFFAPGPEIRAYLEEIIEKYKLWSCIKLQHHVIRAEWHDDEGKWHIRVRKSKDNTGEKWGWRSNDSESDEIEDTANVLFAGRERLSRWSWPDIEGLEQFQEKAIHSAQWETGGSGDSQCWEETVKSRGDEHVGVIGVGPAGIQIASALQPNVGHLTNFAKGKTWWSKALVQSFMLELFGGVGVANYEFTTEDKERFHSNP